VEKVALLVTAAAAVVVVVVGVNNLSQNVTGNCHFGKPRPRWRIMLKWLVGKQCVRVK
jgi:hypothetical protein